MAALVDLQDVVVQALRAHLHLGHAQVTQPADLVRRDLIGPGLDHQSHIAMGGRFVDGLDQVQIDHGTFCPLRFFRRDVLNFIHRIEAALDKPFLIIPSVGGPCPAEDQQLDLVGWMSQGLQLVDPRADLGVRVEVVLQAAHGARLIGQVGFGHAHVGGAEDAFAGTRIRLGQNRDSRHAGERAHRFHADPLEQVGVLLQLPGGDHLVVDRHQHGFVQIPAAREGDGCAESWSHRARVEFPRARSVPVPFYRGSADALRASVPVVLFAYSITRLLVYLSLLPKHPS